MTKAGSVCARGGILQPRLAESLPGTNRSRYARLCNSEPGIDPYTRAVSDVYQDLPGRLVHRQGDLRGRCVRAGTQRALPENRILSHDLVEGGYARAGLLTDVQLYEEFPRTTART